MEIFYKNWLSGKSYYQAFREAQFKVREEYPGPYFWSAFVILEK